jgi:hypothetical protein
MALIPPKAKSIYHFLYIEGSYSLIFYFAVVKREKDMPWYMITPTTAAA